MANPSTLYPKIEPFDAGFYIIDGHEIYYEQCGNPNRKLLFQYTDKFSKT